MSQLYIISLDHDTYSAQQRVSLQLDRGEARREMSDYLSAVLGVRGYVYLSTCNRIELYYESDEDLSDDILRKWQELADGDVDLSVAKIINDTRSSMDHILTLSLGFKSAVFGDDQIITQLKVAFEQARNDKRLTTLLERAYQSMMKCHKRVCNTTEYRTSTVSLAYCTLKRISTYLCDRPNEDLSVLILGAGGMALQVVKYIERFKFGKVDLTNRTISRARQVAHGRRIHVIPYESLQDLSYDIIISCTDHGIIQAKEMSRPTIYADLSITSHESMMNGTHVITLNHMLDELRYHSQNREKATKSVQVIIDHQREEYLSWLQGWHSRRQHRNQKQL